jgi:hypothetical protein
VKQVAGEVGMEWSLLPVVPSERRQQILSMRLESKESYLEHQQATASDERAESPGTIALGSIIILSVAVSFLSGHQFKLDDWLCDLSGVLSAAVLYWLYSTFKGTLSILISLFWATVVIFLWFVNELTPGSHMAATIIGMICSIGIHMEGIRSRGTKQLSR